MITISDVAKKANVSRSTVSRVLNNQTRHMREETRRAVLEAARELKFKPNSIARTLKTKKSHCIGVITDDIDTPFLPSMLKGIEQYAFAHGYNALVCNSGYTLDKQKAYVEMLTQRQIDGVIFAASFVYSITEELINSGLPIVYAYSHSPQAMKNSVLSNDLNGAQQAIEYLIRLGHKRIAYINGPKNVIPSKDRFKGYVVALEGGGIPFDQSLVGFGEWEDPGSGYRAAQEVLSLDDPPTAIFAANDVMAAGVIDAARDLGLRVPEDLSVIGYDDRNMASFLKPALTTVRLPMSGIGSTAAQMVIDCVEQDVMLIDSVFVQCELIIRDSCGPCNRIPPR